MNKNKTIGNILKDNFNSYAVYLILIIILLLARIYSPNYLQLNHIMGILKLSAFLGLAAIGQEFAILSGGIDLSIPYVMSFSFILGAQYMNAIDANIPKAFLICLVMGVIVGAINGIGVSRLKIPAFIMTLGVGTVVRGVYMVWCKGTPMGDTAPLIADISNYSVGPIPKIVILWAIAAAITIIVLKTTPFGRKIYAVGSNIRAAEFSGINTKRLLLSVYIISAVVASFAGVFYLGFVKEANIDACLANYDTDVIAAVIIGGTSISGGKGGYLGAIAGAVIMTVFTDFLTIIRMSAGFRQVGQGVLILLLVLLYARERKVRV